jgi:hypothetical protein
VNSKFCEENKSTTLDDFIKRDPSSAIPTHGLEAFAALLEILEPTWDCQGICGEKIAPYEGRTPIVSLPLIAEANCAIICFERLLPKRQNQFLSLSYLLSSPSFYIFAIFVPRPSDSITGWFGAPGIPSLPDSVIVKMKNISLKEALMRFETCRQLFFVGFDVLYCRLNVAEPSTGRTGSLFFSDLVSLDLQSFCILFLQTLALRFVMRRMRRQVGSWLLALLELGLKKEKEEASDYYYELRTLE